VPDPRLRRPRRRTVAIGLLALAGLLLGAGATLLAPQPLLPEATAALEPGDGIRVVEVGGRGGRLEFAPEGAAPTTGLIVYPGGKVPPAAYAPLARQVAAGGYLVAVVPMPLNLAVLGVDAALPVIAAHPEVRSWAIGGHSLGGAMAAQFVADHPGAIAGLALWASYSPADLAASNIAAVSVWGSLDAGAERMGGPEARAALPPDAVFLELAGGNHEQMGWYTGQPNDPPATLGRTEQTDLVAAATLELLARLAGMETGEAGASPPALPGHRLRYRA
jgi:hypothetical protein